MYRLHRLSIAALIILAEGFLSGFAVPSAHGQTGEEHVDIRVKAETGRQGIPVQLIYRGEVRARKTTSENGIINFTDLSPGKYTIEVPRKDVVKAVEIDGRLTKVVAIPRAASERTSARGATITETENGGAYLPYEVLLYGILVVLLVVAGSLSYLGFRRTKGGGLGLPALELGAIVGTRTNSGASATVSQQERRAREGRTTENEKNEEVTSGSASFESRSKDGSPHSTDTEPEKTTNARTDTSAGVESEETKFGQYTTQKKIGSGGMSSVWLAEDGAGRDVALKVMSEDMLDDEDLVRKFIQEGEALQRINSTHPDAPVVQVHDHGYFEGGDQPYLALEYLQGNSLEGVIDPKSPLSVEQALPVVKQIAIALSAAHANGVYHRDIKPENVLVVGRSSMLKVRLIDFGVARHDYLSYVTMDGSIMGTPPYMSPEQGANSKVDEKSDIYSLGALSYALLAGEPPFVDENPLTVLEMHQEASVPSLPDRVPTSVVDLICWMLEKNPEDRPSQMWQVVGCIDELIVSILDGTDS
jgi:hypothetical protein